MPNLGYRNAKGIYASGTAGAAPSGDTIIHGRAFYIGGSGHLAYETQAGDAVYLKALPIGYYDFPHRKVYGTGSTADVGQTTATDIISFT